MRSLQARRSSILGMAVLSLAVCLTAVTGAARVQAVPAAGAVVRVTATGVAPLTGMKLGPLTGMRVAPLARKAPSRGGASLAPLASGALDGRVIVVDPGHNGVYRKATNTKRVPAGNGRTKNCNSSGTSTSTGFAEHKFNWKVAVNLVRELRSRGASVILTRPDNNGIGPCVNERAAIGNRARADLVVSIHADGSYARGARGFHLIISTTMVGGSAVEAASKALAVRMRAKLDRLTGIPRSTYIGRGTALSLRSDIAGLNLSKVPVVMLEAGNMRNRSDAGLLTQVSFRQKLAKALADGAQAQLSAR